MKDSGVSEESAGLQLTRRTLARTRTRALRHRCWYKVLSRLERGIVELTIRCVEEVKSTKLQSTLMKIIGKLIQALRPGYLRTAEIVGRPLAARISCLAQSWGNARAAEWEDDT
ncbi:MAG: hypothetical protein ACETV1_07070, partial [Candidatus Bathyarchaeia archaeon]